MLLQHAWLAPLMKPETIMEEDEEEEAAADGHAATTADKEEDEEGFVDREVGEWVIQALEKKTKGMLGTSAKPALHAAPLDAVPSPALEKDVKPVAVDP
jgi:mitogen-activated protein kinase kinase